VVTTPGNPVEDGAIIVEGSEVFDKAPGVVFDGVMIVESTGVDEASIIIEGTVAVNGSIVV